MAKAEGNKGTGTNSGGGKRNRTPTPKLPAQPIDKVLKPLAHFMHIQAASGFVLLGVTLLALFLANSAYSESFLGFWETKVGVKIGGFDFTHKLRHWINDGLMAVFFFVVGLEVKRELVHGELRDPRKAVLPLAAALGGMVLPAALYLCMQFGQPAARGWGIPMATDIAFVVGCMSVLGSRVPHGLRVTLLTLAIADDIGAILVIALGYSASIDGTMLALGVVGIVLVLGMARVGVRSILAYTLVGVGVWFCFHESGIHATIAGVILGVMTPAQAHVKPEFFSDMTERLEDVVHGDWDLDEPSPAEMRKMGFVVREMVSPLDYLEHLLHPWVGFFIMPIFALANAGVPITPSDLGSSTALAVVLGLVVGKPLGVLLLSWLAVKLGWGVLPAGVNWKMLLGGGCLAGIGFTMALFVAGLALSDPLLNQAKIGVLAGSLASALLGLTLLLLFGPKIAVPPRV